MTDDTLAIIALIAAVVLFLIVNYANIYDEGED